jgi:vacuolar-type H+-ATPase subunit B/Vma2
MCIQMNTLIYLYAKNQIREISISRQKVPPRDISEEYLEIYIYKIYPNINFVIVSKASSTLIFSFALTPT